MLGLGVVSKLWNDPNIRTSVGDLVSKTLKADLELLQNSTELSYRLMRRGLQAGLPTRDSKDNRLEDTADVVKDLIQVNVGYYSTLIDLNLAFTNRLLKAVDATATPGTASTQSSSVNTVPEMKLVAKVGECLRVPFRVENNRAETTTISFHLTPFTQEGDQSQAIESEASFDPPEITLDPHQEVQTFLVLPVTSVFTTPGIYKATLSVEGIDARKIQVTLEVTDLA